jgi:murein DD-endopeptidase MepM/ murein hydrolase activator NlpD
VDTTYVGQRIAVPQEVKEEKSSSVTSVRKNTTPKIYTKHKGSKSFQWPVIGRITSGFGWRHGYNHKGIDIWNAQKSTAAIRSALGGTVVRAGYSPSYGNLVVIKHPGGWETYYAHMSRITVNKGQTVDTGQMVGYMGRTGHATGYHLHFEVHKHGQAVNPLVLLK